MWKFLSAFLISIQHDGSLTLGAQQERPRRKRWISSTKCSVAVSSSNGHMTAQLHPLVIRQWPWHRERLSTEQLMSRSRTGSFIGNSSFQKCFMESVPEHKTQWSDCQKL